MGRAVRAAVKAQLPPGLSVHSCSGGIVTQLGPAPQLGDTVAGLVPASCVVVSRVLRLVRVDPPTGCGGSAQSGYDREGTRVLLAHRAEVGVLILSLDCVSEHFDRIGLVFQRPQAVVRAARPCTEGGASRADLRALGGAGALTTEIGERLSSDGDVTDARAVTNWLGRLPAGAALRQPHAAAAARVRQPRTSRYAPTPVARARFWGTSCAFGWSTLRRGTTSTPRHSRSPIGGLDSGAGSWSAIASVRWRTTAYNYVPSGLGAADALLRPARACRDVAPAP